MKVALLILGCLLLVQFGHPMPAADSRTSSSEEDTPRAVFQRETFKQIRDFYRYSLNGMSKVFASVIENAEDESNLGEELKKHLTEFTQFIEDVKKSSADENIPKLLDLLNVMTDITVKYQTAAEGHPEQFPDHLSLPANGFLLFTAVLPYEAEDFQTSFTKTVNDYISSLTDAEAKKEEKLIDWFNKYKTSRYTSQKYNSFVELFREEA